jgi:hypothetical protein
MSRNYVHASGEPSQKEEQALTVSKDNKLYHVFRFLQKSYGNDIGKFLTSFNSVLAFGSLANRVNNKKVKLVLNSLKYGVPAFLYGADLYNNIKNYIKETREEQSPTYNKRVSRLCELLGIKYGDESLYQSSMLFDYDLILWLTLRPNTKKIKMLGLYNSETNVEMDSITNLTQVRTPIILKIEFNGSKYLIEATIITADQYRFVDQTSLIGVVLSDLEIEAFRHALVCEFIESLNIKKNTLYFDSSSSIKCTPRTKVEENICQYDVPEFIKEIRQVLDCGRKRAYVLVSRPGTGKSTILRKIEEVMTDTVIFNFSSEDLNSASKIEERFTIAKKIPKCIVFIEDLDACGMHEKNSQTGMFLNAIDEVNNDLNMVIIVTVNDTSRVHFSVINRPGRFDKVIEIKPPQTIEEVYTIMASKAKKLKRNYCPDVDFDIPPRSFNEIESIGAQTYEPNLIDVNLLQKCLDNDYTQAEIANAVTEQIFLDASISVKEKICTWKEAHGNFNVFFKSAVESHETTRAALKNCNFKNEDPTNIKDDEYRKERERIEEEKTCIDANATSSSWPMA